MTALLEASGICKRFGGAAALQDVSLDVRPGETLGLIGPNGAGKTTLFNVVTGLLRPDAGTVRFDGRAIDRLSPARRAGRGLVRTFQKPAVFPALSVRENIALAVRRRTGTGLAWVRARGDGNAADRLAAEHGLAGRTGTRVGDLSYGEQRTVDVLIALALHPRLLLLDEPTAGLARDEADRLLDTVRRHGGAVVLIAHDMDVVFDRCDRIAVLDGGRLLCCGIPASVRADPGVQAAYLGKLAA